MSGLEEIKARAAAASDDTKPVTLEEAFQVVARSQADVPKLVALIEKIRDDAAEWADQYEASADRLWALVRNRDPERDAEDAQRYSHYASGARATARIIDKTIKEGLTK